MFQELVKILSTSRFTVSLRHAPHFNGYFLTIKDLHNLNCISEDISIAIISTGVILSSYCRLIKELEKLSRPEIWQ